MEISRSILIAWRRRRSALQHCCDWPKIYALADNLPFINDISTIEIMHPEECRAGLAFQTVNGNIPLNGLSLGHRTATAWIIYLAL